MLHFWESQSTLFKNGQKKCPKSKNQNTFWITFSFLNNKLPKQLKEPTHQHHIKDPNTILHVKHIPK
jgi:hypothetical protein